MRKAGKASHPRIAEGGTTPKAYLEPEEVEKVEQEMRNHNKTHEQEHRVLENLRQACPLGAVRDPHG